MPFVLSGRSGCAGSAVLGRVRPALPPLLAARLPRGCLAACGLGLGGKGRERSPAGTTRPAPAGSSEGPRPLPRGAAGLHFPARPAPPPQRPGQEDGGARVALGYCALPAAGFGAGHRPAERSVAPREGACRPCALPCPQPGEGRTPWSGRGRRRVAPRRAAGLPSGGGGAGPRGRGLPVPGGRGRRQPPKRAPASPRWRALSVSSRSPRLGRPGRPVCRPSPGGTPGGAAGGWRRESAPWSGGGIRERPRDFPS